jgi:hypothetical protein
MVIKWVKKGHRMQVSECKNFILSKSMYSRRDVNGKYYYPWHVSVQNDKSKSKDHFHTLTRAKQYVSTL